MYKCYVYIYTYILIQVDIGQFPLLARFMPSELSWSITKQN